MNDPRKLKPGALIRLLNSTPAGHVLDDRRLRRHRERAGTRLGDGQTLDVLRYAAWLAAERHAAAPPASTQTDIPPGTPAEASAAYLSKREAERARHAAKSRQGRNVGPLPPVADPARRAAAAAALKVFAETYFARLLYHGWSDDLLEAVAILEQVVRDGARFALAMPRGGGKSTLVVIALLWAVLNGYRRFAVGVAATKELGVQLIDNVKNEILTNDLLAADYPEAIHPLRELECIAQRANGQHLDGAKTFVKWQVHRVVFASIVGSPSSGAVIHVCGLSSAIRGLNVSGQRPDLALLDDIQTDVSARNPLSVMKRTRLIDGAVLGLAGPGKTIAVYAALTIIQPNDVAAGFTDRDKRPEWNGRRYRLLNTFPTDMEPWRAYWDVRQAELRAKTQGDVTTPLANAFYEEHRAAMDLGASVAWENRKLPTELSAVQHAMNLYFVNPRVFAAEYQNDPEPEEEGGGETLEVAALEGRTNGLPMGRVPLKSTILVAHIDVQHHLLYWHALACDGRLTGAIVGTGCWPGQRMKYFAYREASPKLGEEYPGHQKAAAVRAGLIDLVRHLRSRRWEREDSHKTLQSLDLITIDWSDGEMADVVAEVCRLPEFAGFVLPTEGRGIGPAEKPMDQYNAGPGEQLGHHWMAARRVKKGVQVLVVDVNYWKTHAAGAITAPLGNVGSIALFGTAETDHRMLFDHYTAEAASRLRDERTDRVVQVWRVLPNRDNHHWDNLVGCCAAAAFRGAKVEGALVRDKKPRLKLSEIQNRRRRS